ncbi:putative homoserine O-succinyltransferase [Lentilactobacillus kisonensis F0435]|uniref:Homoserine O-acetyltransferase n=2 Tax=Lentilactobacillus kisonensis TaxID=481722 RepID=H1LED0_9LACO|nr:putative homoserine O-succinyltransferase [Lentilactobacillus kisonensis F0435]
MIEMTVNATNGLIRADGEWPDCSLKDPISIVVLNLMPTRKTTELQFLSRFDDCQFDVQLTFMYPATHHFNGAPRKLIEKNYVNLTQIYHQQFDGLIITGAPVETLPFEDVDYWQEISTIIDWAKTHVKEKLFECWAAQAGLYHDFGIQKQLLPAKLFGIYTATKVDLHSPLTAGFDADYPIRMPQSRNTQSIINETHLPNGLRIVVSARQSGPMILSGDHTTYITGHPEYQAQTLAQEYQRDLNKHLPIQPPKNYFKNMAMGMVDYSWRTASTKIYENWVRLLVNRQSSLAVWPQEKPKQDISPV